MPVKIKSIDNPYAYRSQKAVGTTDCVSLASNVTFKSIQRVFLLIAFLIATMLIFRNYSDKVQNSQIKEDYVYLRRNDINVPKKVTRLPHKLDDTSISYHKKTNTPKIVQDHHHDSLRSNTNKPIDLHGNINNSKTDVHDIAKETAPIKLNLRIRKKSYSPTMTPIVDSSLSGRKNTTHSASTTASANRTSNHSITHLFNSSSSISNITLIPTLDDKMIITSAPISTKPSNISSAATLTVVPLQLPTVSNNSHYDNTTHAMPPTLPIIVPISTASALNNINTTATNALTNKIITTSSPSSAVLQSPSLPSQIQSSLHQTSAIWLRPNYGFETKFDRKQRHNTKGAGGSGSNTDPLLSRYCWESVGRMDDESRVMLLSRLIGNYTNANKNSSTTTSLKTQSFRNHTFKHLRFCNSHQYQVQTQFQSKQQTINKQKSGGTDVIDQRKRSPLEPPVQTTFYTHSMDNNKMNSNKLHTQLSYPYDFSTAPDYELSVNNMFATQPLDTLYYFLISPHITTTTTTTTTGNDNNNDNKGNNSNEAQCFFGSDRFGHFCVKTSFINNNNNAGQSQKVKVTAGFQSYDITSGSDSNKPDGSDKKNKNKNNNKNNDKETSFIAKPAVIGMNDKMSREIDLPSSSSSSSFESVNVTILLMYRCRRIPNKNKRKSQQSEEELQYELQVSVNAGISFDSIATATLFPIPHHSTDNKYLSVTHSLSLSLHGSNNTLTLVNNSAPSLLSQLQLPPPPPTEYQWQWTFHKDISVLSSATSSVTDNTNSISSSSSSSLWRFGCAYDSCQSPWNIAEILILEKSSSTSSSSSSSFNNNRTKNSSSGSSSTNDDDDELLTEEEIIGGLQHFKHKYNLDMAGAVVAAVVVDDNRVKDVNSGVLSTVIENHNIPPNSESLGTHNRHDSSSKLPNSAIITIANTTNTITVFHNASSSSSSFRKSKMIPVLPAIAYSDCKPFTSHQIDQYTPPLSASAASRSQWTHAVEGVMAEIRQHQQGGEALRQFVMTKASELQVLRDKLFC